MKNRIVTPLGKNILVKKVIHDETSLILKETVMDSTMFDIIVVAVGSEVRAELSAGDIVVCADGLRALPTCMKEHFLIHDSDIFAIESAVVE